MSTTVNEQDLIIRVAGEEGGGTSGQLILTDVTFSAERDNRMSYGIGNDEPQDISPGNKSFSLSFEQELTEQGAVMLRKIVDNGAETALIKSGDVLEFNIGEIRWNSVEESISDDGEVMVTVDADCRNVTGVEGGEDGTAFTF